MNNQQIIADIAVTIYGQEYVTNMAKNGQEIPLHTARGWYDRGYMIKRGEHGIETRLWKRKKAVDGEETKETYYKTKAYLFTMAQVEREVEHVLYV